MRIYLKVLPRSSKNEIIKIGENEYRVKLTAPPVNGEANKALLKALSKHFKVPQSLIRFVGGKSSKTKIIDLPLQ